MKKIFPNYSSRDFVLDLLYTIIGTALVGFALTIFTIPNDIAPGGVSGLATALAYILPVRVSVWTLLMNIPLMFAAWRSLGPRSLLFTLISTLLLSLFIEVGQRFLPTYTDDMLIASVLAGIICGAGMGTLFLRNISTGGTDLLALILRRVFPNVPSGTLLMVIDGLVVATAVIVFKDFNVAIYSTVTIVVESKLIDAITQGVDYAKVIYTVTEHVDDVTKALNEHTERGTTIIPAFGGYTGDGKHMVMTVTKRDKVSQTLRLIRQTDPKAFTFVMDSTEVHGEGFKVD